MIRNIVRSLIESIVRALVPTDTPYAATERLSNRGFVNSIGWVIDGTSWTISASKATAGTGEGLSQSFTLVNSGLSVTFSASLTNTPDAAFSVLFQMDGTTVQTAYEDNPAPGAFSITVTAQAEFNGIKFVSFGNPGLTLDNVSLIA